MVMGPPEATALVIGLDGVIRRFDPAADAGVEARFDLPAGAINRAVHSPGLLRAAVTGKITDQQWRDGVARALAGSVGSEAATAAVAAWSADRGRIDPEVMGLARRVAVFTPVVLFTNATNRLEGDLQAAGLTGEFAAVVSSARIGAAVPSAAAFAAAELAVAAAVTAGLGVGAGPVVYVDDDFHHITAARRHGWEASQFTDAAGLRGLLDAHGLLIYGCDPADFDRPIEPWQPEREGITR